MPGTRPSMTFNLKQIRSRNPALASKKPAPVGGGLSVFALKGD